MNSNIRSGRVAEFKHFQRLEPRDLPRSLNGPPPSVFDPKPILAKLPIEAWERTPYFQALSQETDRVLFFTRVLHWAQQQQFEGKDAQAVLFYHWLAQPEHKTQVPGTIQKSAQQRLQTLQGGGDWGRRFEYLGGRLAQSATDPRMILPMMGASALGSWVTRNAAGYFFFGPGGGASVGAIRARYLPALFGFAAEVPAFTALQRSMVAKPAQGWGHDLVLAATTLGTLRVFGSLGGTLAVRSLRVGSQPTGRQLMGALLTSQASVYSGLLASHEVESFLGLRPQIPGSNPFLEALGNYLSLSVGTHLGRRAFRPLMEGLSQVPDSWKSTKQKTSLTPQRQALLLAPLGMVFGVGIPSFGFKTSNPRPLPDRATTLLSLVENNRQIENSGRLPPMVNPLGLAHRREALLGQFVPPGSRFLELGFGSRPETLQELSRRGVQAEGLELNHVYPEGAYRNSLEKGPVDVLFVNSQGANYFRGKRVATVNHQKLLKHFARARTVMIQSYDARSPVEILRHAELQEGISFRIRYYRAHSGEQAPPLFPSDYGSRPGNYPAVLVAERLQPSERFFQENLTSQSGFALEPHHQYGFNHLLRLAQEGKIKPEQALPQLMEVLQGDWVEKMERLGAQVQAFRLGDLLHSPMVKLKTPIPRWLEQARAEPRFQNQEGTFLKINRGTQGKFLDRPGGEVYLGLMEAIFKYYNGYLGLKPGMLYDNLPSGDITFRLLPPELILEIPRMQWGRQATGFEPTARLSDLSEIRDLLNGGHWPLLVSASAHTIHGANGVHPFGVMMHDVYHASLLMNAGPERVAELVRLADSFAELPVKRSEQYDILAGIQEQILDGNLEGVNKLFQVFHFQFPSQKMKQRVWDRLTEEFAGSPQREDVLSSYQSHWTQGS